MSTKMRGHKPHSNFLPHHFMVCVVYLLCYNIMEYVLGVCVALCYVVGYVVWYGFIV